MAKKQVWIELTCKAGFKQGVNELTAVLKGPHGERDVGPELTKLWNDWWRVVNRDNDAYHEGRMDSTQNLDGPMGDLHIVLIKGGESLTLLDIAETLKEVTCLPIRCIDGEGKEAKVEELD